MANDLQRLSTIGKMYQKSCMVLGDIALPPHPLWLLTFFTLSPEQCVTQGKLSMFLKLFRCTLALPIIYGSHPCNIICQAFPCEEMT